MARQFWADGHAVGRLLLQRQLHIRAVRSGRRGARPQGALGRRSAPPLPAPAAAAIGRHRAAWDDDRCRGGGAADAAQSRTANLEPNVLFTEDVPAAEVAAADDGADTNRRDGRWAPSASLALVLAAVGLYGVVTQSVNRRTREIGIRLAIGARRGQVVRMILFQGGRLALAGVGVGLRAALVGRVLESLLYGISTYAPDRLRGCGRTPAGRRALATWGRRSRVVCRPAARVADRVRLRRPTAVFGLSLF